jgi:hypothetical protein
MQTLEAKSGTKLARLADLAPGASDLRARLSRAACASQVRQAWLEARAATRAKKGPGAVSASL